MARTILGQHAHLLAQETGVPLRAIQGFFDIYIALVSDLGIVHHVFSRIMNLRIYKKKLHEVKVFRLRSK